MYKVVIYNPLKEEYNEIYLNSKEKSELDKLIKEIWKIEILPEEKIIHAIKNLNLEPEIKLILTKLTKLVIKIGNFVLKVGNIILELLLFFLKKYPNTSITILLALVLTIFVSSIPIIGPLLAPIFSAIFLAIGIPLSFINDLKNQREHLQIKEEIQELLNQKLKL